MLNKYFFKVFYYIVLAFFVYISVIFLLHVLSSFLEIIAFLIINIDLSSFRSIAWFFYLIFIDLTYLLAIFVILYPLFLFLKETKNYKNIELIELKEKIKYIVNLYFFKILYYIFLTTSILYLIINVGSFFNWLFKSSSGIFLIISILINIILFSLTFLFKKWKYVELKDSGFLKKMISLIGLTFFLFFLWKIYIPDYVVSFNDISGIFHTINNFIDGFKAILDYSTGL